MKQRIRRIGFACCASAIAVLLAILLAGTAGFRINSTSSYPPGIYRLTGAPMEKGALVIFCPPASVPFDMARERGYIGIGYCAGGTGYMIKKIAAAKDDRVAITAEGVYVNGALLANSRPMEADSLHHPLPRLRIATTTLDAHSVLLMSDYSPKSFDARYFGIMDRSQIISSITPVWTFAQTASHWPWQ